MVDITHKSNTLRYAKAQAVLTFGDAATVQRINEGSVPKGSVFDMARAAALLAIKKTFEIIPDCHPLPVEFAAVHFFTAGNTLRIEVEVKTIYKTGVEVEAMHGASVAALTAYDMLKPIEKKIVIGDMRLLEKQGGKSDHSKGVAPSISAAVIVCSDSIAAGKNEDRAGKSIIGRLERIGVKVADYLIIPDEIDPIRSQLTALVEKEVRLIIFTGGTGLSKRDVTPEAIRPLLERTIPGIEEVMRDYGQERMPYAMLSRSVAGMIGDTLVLALPGSTKGAEESMDAIFPQVLHLFRVLDSLRHEEA